MEDKIEFLKATCEHVEQAAGNPRQAIAGAI
jgi:hypothetical protein